jgi:uncharacterized membrane protein
MTSAELMKNTNPAEKNHLVQVQQHYSGPLPHPDALARYDEIVPGAAERIIRMAEKEMEHRHSTDDQLNKNAIRATYLGITFAFISVLILSGSVIYALYKGFDTVAASIAVGSIAAVAGVFIFFKSKQSK